MKPARSSKRVVLNRAMFDKIHIAAADGLQAVGEKIIYYAEQRVPDAPPLGQGLITTGVAATWVDGKRIAGRGTPPKSARVPREGIVTYVGFGFPGRFVELGTQFMNAEPFLTPSIYLAVPEAGDGVAQVVADRIR